MAPQRNAMQQMSMLYGTYMGIFWIAKFVLFPMALVAPLCGFLFMVFTCAVPVIAYFMTRHFRDRYCAGELSFFSGLVFCFQIFLYASVLTAMAHFIYFKFIDHHFIYDNMTALIDVYKNEAALKSQVENIKHALNVFNALSPIELAMQLLSQNVFYGIILSMPIALLTMRRPAPTLRNKPKQ